MVLENVRKEAMCDIWQCPDSNINPPDWPCKYQIGPANIGVRNVV